MYIELVCFQFLSSLYFSDFVLFILLYCYRAGAVPTPDVYDQLYTFERGRDDLHVTFDVTDQTEALKGKQR